MRSNSDLWISRGNDQSVLEIRVVVGSPFEGRSSPIKGLTMNPNALAEVYVGKQDGNGEKKYDGFATGYPIAQDRVITAGHVLSGDYNFIEVRFRNSKENARLIPATREWPRSAEFDVAVLSCTIPKDVPGNPSLLTHHDSSSTNGRVLGYPRVDDTHNKPGDARELFNSTGELGALERIAPHFVFRVNYDFRKQGEGWKGLSGAPVFLESRIAGIVQEYLGYATVAEFRVVAMCRLLEDSSFRAAIGWLDGPGEDVRNAIRDRIERRLKRLSQPEVTKSPVLRDLERELRSADDDSEFPESKDPIPVILEALLDQRSLSTISGLSEIYEQRCKESDWRAAEIVAEIIDEETPLVINPELAIWIWNEIKVRRTAMFFTPVGQSAAAEVLMARADGKSMKVKPPKEFPVKDFDGWPLLRGGGSSLGRPVTEKSLAESILLDLCEGQGVADSANQPQTLDVLVERFAGILIDNSRGVNKGRTLYGFHKMPENPRDHPVHTGALTLIRDELAKTKRDKPNEFKGLPGFVFLVLAQKSEHEGLQTVVVQMLKRRFEREKNRTGHVATH